MRIKLDENLPAGLCAVLARMGHDVDTVLTEGLAGVDDDAVWQATQGARRFLITQDLDFSDARRFVPGTHHGVLIVRLREPGRLALMARIEALFLSEDVDSWSECLLIASDHKLRIRRPT